MGCCNDTSTVLAGQPPTPSQHVNYTKGMVLGVDDFIQEFTYLSDRDQWAIREILGYGTTSGLAVRVEDDGANGPRIHVTPGAAVAPGGKLICVQSEQCCLINHWLAKPENAKTINGLPPQDGLQKSLSLYLTLCYSDCQTAPVPIPGEPCRSDDTLMAPSRIADDYRLELRTEAPPQTEEDAVRDFVAWLKQVPVMESSPPSVVEEKLWLDGLKAAAKPWLDAMSANPSVLPPPSYKTLGDYLFDSPPTTLVIAREQLSEFLRVAFRFWVTDLRPMWMNRLCGAAARADEDCVLLARLEVPVIWVGEPPAGVWEVNDKAVDHEFKNIHIDQSRRPYLASLRLLQEWLLCDFAGERVGPSIPAPLPQNLSTTSSPRFKGITTTGAVQIAIKTVIANLTLDETHHCVICETPLPNPNPNPNALTLTLPKCRQDNRGRVYVVKSQVGTSKIKVESDSPDTIDGKSKEMTISAQKTITLVSDGFNIWHVIAKA